VSIVTNGRALTLSPAEASRRLLSFLRVRIGVTPRRDHRRRRSSSSFGQRRMSDRVTDYWAIDRLGFGPHDGRQTSARSLALIDTTIPPPLKPARDGPDARAHREDRVGRQRGDEMNLALSASQLTVQAIPERGVCSHAAGSLESRPAHGHCQRDRARAGAGSAYRGAKSARRWRPPGNHRTPRSDPL